MIVLRFIACAHTVAMLSNGEYFNPELNEQKDLDLFEGDIVLSEAQRRIINSGNITSYSAIEGGHWPDGIVPYIIVDSFNSKTWPDSKFKFFTKKERRMIKLALKYFKYSTCIKFVKKRKHHEFYVRIQNELVLNKETSKLEEKGCTATYGRDPTRDKGQPLIIFHITIILSKSVENFRYFFWVRTPKCR